MNDDFESMVGRTFVGALFLALVAAAVVGLYCAGASIRSDGRSDYCYIDMWSPSGMSPQYKLYGHVPWRTAREYGCYNTVDEARAKADMLGCGLK